MSSDNGTVVVENGTATETGKAPGRTVKPVSVWGKLYTLAGKMDTRATSLKRVLAEGTVTVRLDGFPSSRTVDALAGLASVAGVKGTMAPVDGDGNPLVINGAAVRHTFAGDGDKAEEYVRNMLSK
jgi:hypothetical protein